MWTTVATKTMITEVEAMETWTSSMLVITMVTESMVSEVESVITWSSTFVLNIVVDNVVFNSTMVSSSVVSIGESMEVSVSVSGGFFSTFSVVTGMVIVLSFFFCSTLLTMVSAFVSGIWMTSVSIMFMSFVIPTVTDKVTTGMFDLRPDLFFLCSLYVHIVRDDTWSVNNWAWLMKHNRRLVIDNCRTMNQNWRLMDDNGWPVDDNIRSMDNDVRSVVQFWTWVEHNVGTLHNDVLFISVVNVTVRSVSVTMIPISMISMAVMQVSCVMVSVFMAMEASFSSVSSFIVGCKSMSFVTSLVTTATEVSLGPCYLDLMFLRSLHVFFGDFSFLCTTSTILFVFSALASSVYSSIGCISITDGSISSRIDSTISSQSSVSSSQGGSLSYHWCVIVSLVQVGDWCTAIGTVATIGDVDTGRYNIGSNSLWNVVCDVHVMCLFNGLLNDWMLLVEYNG